MKIGPRYKIAKRLGAGVFEKTQTQKFALSAERRARSRGGKHPRSFTDYGRQLIEKQKVRFTYGITEGQLARYVNTAAQKRGAETIAELHRTLERRLDNVVYRMGIAPTRRGARQMVAHGHIQVAGKRVTIPSYQVSQGEIVSVRKGSQSSPLFVAHAERMAQVQAPNWLTFDAGKLEGAVVGEPVYEAGTSNLDYASVMEFYSR